MPHVSDIAGTDQLAIPGTVIAILESSSGFGLVRCEVFRSMALPRPQRPDGERF